jgi:hypothetical protein
VQFFIILLLHIKTKLKCFTIIEAPYCVYHCKQLDKTNKFGKHAASESKYSMNKPTNRFGVNQSLFGSTPTDVKFVSPSVNRVSNVANKMSMIEQRTKVCKEIKSEILNSLNCSISKTVDPAISTMGKMKKKSDQELLAIFEGKELDKEEIKKIRIAEQSSSILIHHSKNTEGDKQLSKLFSSKALLPNENTANYSITGTKMLEYKKQNEAEMKIMDTDYTSAIKKKYQDNQVCIS